MAENQSRRRKAARATRPERVRHGPGKARGAGGKGGPADIRPVGPFRRIIGILLILGGVRADRRRGRRRDCRSRASCR